jgi:hypothetical protein
MIKSYEERKTMWARLFWSTCWALLLLSSYTACVAEDTSHGPEITPDVTTGVHAAAGSDEPDRKAKCGAGFERRVNAYDATTQTHHIIGGCIRLGRWTPMVNARDASAGQASPTIDLETVGVSRGDVALDVTVLGSGLPEPGTVEIVRAEFVEMVQDIPDGIEQSWRFEHAPGKAGDLVVAVGTPDLEYVGTTDDGLKLRRAGEFDVHYSHGIWIDADGHSWAVRARYDKDRIMLTVPADIVANSSFPVVLDPKIIVTPLPG